MATICKKVCDRCGKQIHYIGWTSKLKKIGILSILNGNPSGYDYSYCDYGLCRMEKSGCDRMAVTSKAVQTT